MSTDSNSAPCNAEFHNTAPGPALAASPQDSSAIDADSAPDSALTGSDENAGEDAEKSLMTRLLDQVQEYWTPPVVWTQVPPSLAELRAYAWSGPWTAERGFFRRAGIWWYRLAGWPVTSVCRYVEWIAQRPGRAATVAGIYVLLAHTTPGQYVLPWPSWLP